MGPLFRYEGGGGANGGNVNVSITPPNKILYKKSDANNTNTTV